MVVADEADEGTESDSAMDVEVSNDNIERSKVAFQLDKICKLLQLAVPTDADEHEILHSLARRISDALQASPDLLTHGPPVILSNLGELSAQQMAKLNTVEDLLFKVTLL